MRPPTPAPGDYSATLVGDETDTSPFADAVTQGISVRVYVRNMSTLIQFVDTEASR